MYSFNTPSHGKSQLFRRAAGTEKSQTKYQHKPLCFDCIYISISFSQMSAVLLASNANKYFTASTITLRRKQSRDLLSTKASHQKEKNKTNAIKKLAARINQLPPDALQWSPSPPLPFNIRTID